jgi:glycosyltransferase involved in cell wall biosynthesis
MARDAVSQASPTGRSVSSCEDESLVGLQNRDIICLSTHFWDERWFRKQEFMSRFAKANRVLYVEPSFSMARGPEEHLAEVATNRFFVPQLERREENVHLLKPPRGLPKWSDPRVERLNYRWYGRVVGNAAERLGLRDAILWVYRPAFLAGLDAIPHERLVFDLVDDLAAYGSDDGASGGHHAERLVTALVQRADLLVVTAKTLLERYGSQARAVAQVANGFDGDLFAADRPHEVPATLAGLPRPILGFIGTLFHFLDFELMEEVARAHRDKSIVLVGPVEANAEDAVTRLKRLPNVHHLGRQPQSTMPAYIAGFDVCLNPFRRSRVADSVNPLKVYEYLAAGKPVVSTAMEALRRENAGRVVAFADGPAEFCEQIDRCLTPGVLAAAEDRRGAALPYSWERLFEQLDDACEAALPSARAG